MLFSAYVLCTYSLDPTRTKGDENLSFYKGLIYDTLSYACKWIHLTVLTRCPFPSNDEWYEIEEMAMEEAREKCGEHRNCVY